MILAVSVCLLLIEILLIVRKRHQPELIFNKLSFRPYGWAMAQLTV